MADTQRSSSPGGMIWLSGHAPKVFDEVLDALDNIAAGSDEQYGEANWPAPS